jgi:hypothetical protein
MKQMAQTTLVEFSNLAPGPAVPAVPVVGALWLPDASDDE